MNTLGLLPFRRYIQDMSSVRLVKRDRLGRTLTSETQTTAADLKGKTYAVFTGTGMRVDLKSFFKSDSGQKALKRVSDSALSQRPPKSR